MKQYSKPIADVVELTVRENIAQLPYAHAIVTGNVEQTTIRNHSVTLTTYNLATLEESNTING